MKTMLVWAVLFTLVILSGAPAAARDSGTLSEQNLVDSLGKASDYTAFYVPIGAVHLTITAGQYAGARVMIRRAVSVTEVGVYADSCIESDCTGAPAMMVEVRKANMSGAPSVNATSVVGQYTLTDDRDPLYTRFERTNPVGLVLEPGTYFFLVRPQSGSTFNGGVLRYNTGVEGYGLDFQSIAIGVLNPVAGISYVEGTKMGVRIKARPIFSGRIR